MPTASIKLDDTAPAYRRHPLPGAATPLSFLFAQVRARQRAKFGAGKTEESWIDRNLGQGIFNPLITGLVNRCHELNLVEQFKRLVRYLGKSWAMPRSLDNVAIDIFIASKWLLIGALWCLRAHCTIAHVVAWYFLLTNWFTYFYYHLWQQKVYESNSFSSAEEIHRRLFNAIQAFGFSLLVYAYMYDVLYGSELIYPPDHRMISALVFSVSNSLTVGYGAVLPNTTAGRALATSQLVMTVAFLVGVISKTLGSTLKPGIDSKEE